MAISVCDAGAAFDCNAEAVCVRIANCRKKKRRTEAARKPCHLEGDPSTRQTKIIIHISDRGKVFRHTQDGCLPHVRCCLELFFQWNREHLSPQIRESSATPRPGLSTLLRTQPRLAIYNFQIHIVFSQNNPLAELCSLFLGGPVNAFTRVN